MWCFTPEDVLPWKQHCVLERTARTWDQAEMISALKTTSVKRATPRSIIRSKQKQDKRWQKYKCYYVLHTRSTDYFNNNIICVALHKRLWWYLISLVSVYEYCGINHGLCHTCHFRNKTPQSPDQGPNQGSSCIFDPAGFILLSYNNISGALLKEVLLENDGCILTKWAASKRSVPLHIGRSSLQLIGWCWSWRRHHHLEWWASECWHLSGFTAVSSITWCYLTCEQVPCRLAFGTEVCSWQLCCLCLFVCGNSVV